MATEIPSHNLREVAAAAVALIRNDKLADDELFALLPGPDFPGGGQIISSAADMWWRNCHPAPARRRCWKRSRS
jgi:topoisomerase-4 subunit A